MICCAIIQLTGKKCTNNAKIKTNENLNVCNFHSEFKLKDIERINKNIQEKQKRLKKQEEILILNKELLNNNIGKIPLRNKDGLIIDFALVNEEDFENVMKNKWHKSDNGYALSNNKILMHQFILGKSKDKVIDHINHNKLDNQRENLIFNTHSGNAQNKEKKEGKSSKYLGATWGKKIKKWSVFLCK